MMRVFCFGGAVVFSSSFDNILKSSQANCRPEIGSYTLRLEVLAPGLNGSSLGGELPLDPFFFQFFWCCKRRGTTWRWVGGVHSLLLLWAVWTSSSFLWCHSYWAHLTSYSVVFCLVGLHTFGCCDLYCLVELSEHLKMETGLCSAVLAVDVVECHHHSIHSHCSS